MSHQISNRSEAVQGRGTFVLFFLAERAIELEREHDMKAFVAACLAAVALAAIGLAVLNHVQEPVDQAFATSYARVG